MNSKSRARRRKRRCFNKKPNSFKCDTRSIMHSNIRGVDSKRLSLKLISDKADVLTLNETFLKNNRKLQLPGFNCYNRNRMFMGVVLLLV